jgi:hypothetical protein
MCPSSINLMNLKIQDLFDIYIYIGHELTYFVQHILLQVKENIIVCALSYYT